MTRDIYLHFDYVKNGANVTLGAMGFKTDLEQTPVLQCLLEIDGEDVQYDNQYHLTIRALILGLMEVRSFISKNKLDDVRLILHNQNELVFKWLSQRSYGYDYESLFEELFNVLSEIVESVQVEFKIIEGKYNKAKKALSKRKKHVKPKRETQKLNLDFLKKTSVTDEEVEKVFADNVVNFKSASMF